MILHNEILKTSFLCVLLTLKLGAKVNHLLNVRITKQHFDPSRYIGERRKTALHCPWKTSTNASMLFTISS